MNEVLKPRKFAQAVLQEVSKKMFGLDEVLRFCLIALYTNGHVLLEGNPGLGKTELVKTLGEALELENNRIQFTPDLMPSGVTGTFMPDISGDVANMQALKFRKGPIFTSLLLADEINRATPKTQSAMLEAMAERQVTVLGDRYKLPEPFFVLATQNPIDHEGTYDLPEAQLDRFMFKIDMPTPAASTLSEIVKKETENNETENNKVKVMSVPAQYIIPTYESLFRSIKDIKPRLAIQQHIHNIIQASNKRPFELMEDETKGIRLDPDQIADTQSIADFLRYGFGPRAAIFLMRGAKAWSLFFSQEPDPKTHIQALAKVMIPTLCHRVKLDYDWKEKYRKWEKDKRAKKKRYSWPVPGDDKDERDKLLKCMLADFCMAAAPTQDGYHDVLKGIFNDFFATTNR